MAGKQRYTAAQVIAALLDTKGLVFLAARQLGCDADTVRNYMKRYPSVRAAAVQQRGEMVDLAESKLWQAIEDGEAWAITLCLKTLGKDRGYVERHEVVIPWDTLTDEQLLRLAAGEAPEKVLQSVNGAAPSG